MLFFVTTVGQHLNRTYFTNLICLLSEENWLAWTFSVCLQIKTLEQYRLVTPDNEINQGGMTIVGQHL